MTGWTVIVCQDALEVHVWCWVGGVKGFRVLWQQGMFYVRGGTHFCV